MKLKGIGTFEQHIEKIVLGVMMVVLLAVVSLQFLYEPNRVDIGGKTIAPDEVFGQLETDVNRLRAAVDDPNPTLPTITTPNLVDDLQRALAKSTTTRVPTDVAFGPVVSIGGDAAVGPVANGPIMPMTIAEPMTPTAISSWITADPYVLIDNPELEPYLPAEQPFDIVGVTVEATIDGALALQMLREADSGHRPIPATWWRPGVAVMEVVAERQERGLDGQWSASQPVMKIPGAFDLMQAVGMETTPTPLELRDVVQDALSSEEAIARPSYVPQVAGPDWMAPAEAIARNEQFSSMSEVDVLRAKRRLAKQKITRLEGQLQANPQQPQQSTGRTSPDLINPSKGYGGGGRDSTSTSTSNADRARAREEARVANINKQIDQQLDQIKDMEDQLASLGFPVANDDDRTGRPVNITADDEAAKTFLGNEAFRVWAHDLDVVQGAEYRYRLRIKVNNPIYGKEKSLNAAVGDDMNLARQPYAFSPWSSWSEPTMVGQKSYLFLNNADEARRTGGGINLIGGSGARVSAEVFHMYYGHYRRGSITLEPGDMAYTEVRVGDGLYLIDTELVGKDVAYSLLGVNESSKFGQGNIGVRRPPTSRDDVNRDSMILTPDEFVTPRKGPQTQNRPGTRQPEPIEPEELPEGVTKAPAKVAVTLDAMLLDVVQLPIGDAGADGGNPLFYVYFETQGGVVEHRRPDEDRQSAAYEAVRASYQLGKPADTKEDE